MSIFNVTPHKLLLLPLSVSLTLSLGCGSLSEDALPGAPGEDVSLDANDDSLGPDGDSGSNGNGTSSGGASTAGGGASGDGDGDSTGTGGQAPLGVEIEEIVLRTLNTGHLVRATESGISADGTSVGEAETLRLHDQNGGDLEHGDEVQIRSATGQILLVDPTTFALSWAETGGTVLTLLREQGAGTVASGNRVGFAWGGVPNYLKSIDGGGSTILGDVPWMQEWETFVIDRLAFPKKGFQTLAFLKSIAGSKIVSGQHNDQKDGTDENHYTDRVHEITGKYPALYGADFLFHGSSEMRWDITYEAERQWEAGAIVNLMWHACPPNQGESCQWDGGLLSGLSDDQWSDLITDGGNLNGIWKSRMDQIAVFLTYLRDKGVEVLFRPLHEQNQGAFWWGGRTGEGGTIALYRLTHDYFTLEKGLDNLIWTWDIQDLDTNYGAYNPGPEYFDVMALDIYSDAYSNQAYYNAMLTEAGDKPVAIGECFGLPPEWALQNQSQYTFFMNWAYGLEVDWEGTPTNSISFIQEVYANPRVITLDEMPGWD